MVHVNANFNLIATSPKKYFRSGERESLVLLYEYKVKPKNLA